MRTAVIGAGSWGTALAQVAAENGHNAVLWARRGEIAREISERHGNACYLPGVVLVDSIRAIDDLSAVLAEADAALVAVPSKFARETARAMAECGELGDDLPVALCMKGVEAGTGKVPIEVFCDELGNRRRLAALSGPNHAEEVALGVPSATVVASDEPATAAFFQDLLGSERFRVYTSADVLGVELCAAFKNVIAIAVGVSYGIGYGDNTAAMLMTRGQAEMGRLIEAADGDAMTCMGLAGTGDLIATCMSRHSRNRAFGEALAAGETLSAYEARRHMVVEGAQACRTLATLSERYRVDLPITDTVRALVWEGADIHEVVASLAGRPQKPEFYS